MDFGPIQTVWPQKVLGCQLGKYLYTSQLNPYSNTKALETTSSLDAL